MVWIRLRALATPGVEARAKAPEGAVKLLVATILLPSLSRALTVALEGRAVPLLVVLLTSTLADAVQVNPKVAALAPVTVGSEVSVLESNGVMTPACGGEEMLQDAGIAPELVKVVSVAP
jgi:hypothetical protein